MRRKGEFFIRQIKTKK